MSRGSTWVGAALAGMIAALSACNERTAPTKSGLTPGPAPAAGTPAKHACRGQNACKGQGGCGTDRHACRGLNDCRGQGGCNMS
jgi:hypothetical protein